MTIQNYPPSAVTLLNPADGIILGALPEFNWTESSDIDPEDTISYILEISTNSNFAYLNYTNTLTEIKDENVVLTSNEINKYYWRVNASDGIDSISSFVRTFNYSQWNITFNVTSGEDGASLDNIDISCNYAGFSQAGDTTNPYGPYGFPSGTWTCTFDDPLNYYYDRTKTFTADADKIVDVSMSLRQDMTVEEHTWLEALYNCIILEDCNLWNILREINQTTGYIWQHIQPTDQNVLTLETVSEEVNSTHNITYDATVNVPIKQGYGLGDYLPIRIGYWFIDKDNASKCFSQGEPPHGIDLIEPYCQPLMVQTMGPMGGSVTFRVDLRPSLTIGTYNITRRIEIDPDDVWIPYGHEFIGQIEVTEDSLANPTISVGNENYVNPEKEKETIIIRESGGGGGTTVIEKYYLEPTEKEEDKEETKEEVKEKTEETKKSDMEGITGFSIGKFLNGFSKGSPIVGMLMILIIVVGGLMSYFIIRKKY